MEGYACHNLNEFGMEIAGKIEHLGIMIKNFIVCSFDMGFLIASCVLRWSGYL